MIGRHGAGRGRPRLQADGAFLYCQVGDDGPATPGDQQPTGTAAWRREHGHGLWVVGEVADQLSIDHGPAGTTATAAFPEQPTLLMDLGEQAGRFRFLIRDRDSKFTAMFDHVFAGGGVRIIKAPVRSPRANSFAERYMGTLRRECLDHLLIHGERHLRTVLAEFESRYNHRPRRSRSLHPPVHNPGEAIDMTARINRRTTVSGLINEYHRAA